LRILFSAVLGLLFFNETISLLHFVGIISIVCSYVFICKNCGKTASYYIQKKGKQALQS
jgi:threonine/homoserine efflux transporter RhtA